MNERIQELMPKPWTFPYPDRELFTKEQFEKFAELIVQECALLVQGVPTDTMGYQYHTADKKIKDHFGVE